MLCLSSCGRHCLLLHAGQNLQVSFYLRQQLLEPFRPSTDSTPTPPSFSDQGLLGTTWALYGHYLGTDCVLRWTTWGLLLDYFKAFFGLLGDYLVNVDHFGTTWYPLSDCWRRVPGHVNTLLFSCSPLGPRAPDQESGPWRCLPPSVSIIINTWRQLTKSRGIVIKMYDKIHLSYNLLNHIF